MFPVLQIGGLAVQVPGLILLLGLWLGLAAAERRAAERGLPPDTLYDLIFTGLVSALVGARLAFAAAHPGAFIRSPASLFSLQPGLLDPLGGALAGGLVMAIRIRRRSIPPPNLLDALTPLFAVFAAAIPAANLASGSGYGSPTSVPWAIELWGTARHPSQVYDLVAALVIFALISSERGTGKAGYRFLFFVALTAGARLFLEAFRGDSALLGPGIRVVQVVAWAVLAVALAGLLYLRGGSPGGKNVPAVESNPRNDNH